MRQSKSLGSLGSNLQVGGGSTRRSSKARTPEFEYPASADAYELMEDCGRGVSATVWRARCLTNDQIVAVKILNLEAQIAPLDDIVHEAQTMKAYNSEAILSLFVSFVKDTHLWMVMPYMEGGSVAHIMHYKYPDGLYPEPVIATIMKQVFTALAYVHSHNDIHRDVKAGNVLVDAEGHVKLGDFGVAASMKRDDDWGGTKARSTFVGTPCWMAPEVLEQTDEGYGAKADIWSAGITMLEMAHGHAPFSKLPPMKVLLQTLQGEPPQLEAECGGRHFSRGMREVVASCLNKDPNKRPSAKQLLSKGFFRQAKDAEYLKRTMLAGLPPLPQRCMEIRMGKGRAATLAMENDRAAMASHISYITDVAQWDFACTKSNNEAAGGGEPTAHHWSAVGDKSPTSSLTSNSLGAGFSSSRPSSSRGDQLLEQPSAQQEQARSHSPGAAANGSVLGSSNSLDVPGQQQQQGVVGLHGLMPQEQPHALHHHMQQQQQQDQQQQLVCVSGDVGPGARDVDAAASADASSEEAATVAAAAAAEKAASPVPQASPRSPRGAPAAAAASAAAAHAKLMTCFAGNKAITTFPVSVPDTPDHSPMHSRPTTPVRQGGPAAAENPAAAAARTSTGRAAAASFPGAALSSSSGDAGSGGVVVPGAKKHGRFTFVESSTRYQGPEMVTERPAAAGADASASAAGAPASRTSQLLKQRSVSTPDMALLMSLRAPRSSSSSTGSTVSGSAASPVSPLSPASATLSPTADPAAVAAAAVPGVSSNNSSRVSPPRQRQGAEVVQAAAVPESPGRCSSPGLLGKLLPHKPTVGEGGAGQRHQPHQQPPEEQQHQEHHDLQHKIAGFFAHHGIGKGARSSSPHGSRDFSPHSYHGLHAQQNASSSTGMDGGAAGGSFGAGGAASSSSSAGMGSLSRQAHSLHCIYNDSYSRKEASKASAAVDSPRARSPRTGGHNKSSPGSREHPTAAQIWQHVKEACAETASDVAHIFKSRSGGSLDVDRSHSRSPDASQHQHQEEEVTPQQKSAGDRQAPQQGQQEQPADLLSPFEAPQANTAGRGTAPAAAGAAAAGAASAAATGAAGSSSSLVRLGSKGSGSFTAVSLGSLPPSGSKPPRYQQTLARRMSDEPPKQPQQPLQQGQQLPRQQDEMQHQLQIMQQQQGPSAPEVQEAAAAVLTLSAAAAAVEQAAAAASAAPLAGGMQGASVGSKHAPEGRHTKLGELSSVVPGDDAAAVPGWSELGSRELSFAPTSSLASTRSSTASIGGKADEPGATLTSHALNSPQEQGPTGESSVTFPLVGARDSDSQQQQQQQRRQRSLSPALPDPEKQQSFVPCDKVVAADAKQAGGTLMWPGPQAVAAVCDEQGRGRPEHRQMQIQVEGQQQGLSRSQHASSSPCRHHKGRFTITEA